MKQIGLRWNRGAIHCSLWECLWMQGWYQCTTTIYEHVDGIVMSSKAWESHPSLQNQFDKIYYLWLCSLHELLFYCTIVSTTVNSDVACIRFKPTLLNIITTKTSKCLNNLEEDIVALNQLISSTTQSKGMLCPNYKQFPSDLSEAEKRVRVLYLPCIQDSSKCFEFRLFRTSWRTMPKRNSRKLCDDVKQQWLFVVVALLLRCLINFISGIVCMKKKEGSHIITPFLLRSSHHVIFQHNPAPTMPRKALVLRYLKFRILYNHDSSPRRSLFYTVFSKVCSTAYWPGRSPPGRIDTPIISWITSPQIPIIAARPLFNSIARFFIFVSSLNLSHPKSNFPLR